MAIVPAGGASRGALPPPWQSVCGIPYLLAARSAGAGCPKTTPFRLPRPNDATAKLVETGLIRLGA